MTFLHLKTILLNSQFPIFSFHFFPFYFKLISHYCFIVFYVFELFNFTFLLFYIVFYFILQSSIIYCFELFYLFHRFTTFFCCYNNSNWLFQTKTRFRGFLYLSKKHIVYLYPLTDFLEITNKIYNSEIPASILDFIYFVFKHYICPKKFEQFHLQAKIIKKTAVKIHTMTNSQNQHILIFPHKWFFNKKTRAKVFKKKNLFI